MQIETTMRKDVLLVTVHEERLDAQVAIPFKDKMRDITRDAPPRVVLDLSGVRFLDSSGLGAIISVMKQLAPEGQLELAGLTPAVEKVFHLTRMDTIFTIHADARAAVEPSARAG